ncbi:hypothetical protein C0583_02605 [Candidatus Parcubacteria bacterium]|nr:MAG: hypothetical protein C0583_02605 [Candidatus Parcubacteria bacterium]
MNFKLNKTKTILIVALSLVMLFVVVSPDLQSRTKVYYSGEAITFHNKLVFATTNTGAVELFVLEDNNIVRTAAFKPEFTRLPKGSDTFYDVEFSTVNGKLYMYLSNGTYLSKYDISDPYRPVLVDKLRDNAWDWMMQIETTDDYLVTIGSKEIKFWNSDMQVVNAFDLGYEKTENITISENGEYIFVFVGSLVEIYSTEKREVVADIYYTKNEDSSRGVYYDADKQEIYLVDDEALRVFDINGNEIRRFKHTSNLGYDVEESRRDSSVYFSDGIGVVKSNKEDLKALDWQYTTEIGAGRGWAMDIEVSADSKGDKIVIFNNNEILVLDEDLDLIDTYEARELDYAPIEDLSLSLDKTNTLSYNYVTVSGQGFGLNEKLEITIPGYRDAKWSASSDSNGRFTRTILIPRMKAQTIDIRVEGMASELTYSISLNVK